MANDLRFSVEALIRGLEKTAQLRENLEKADSYGKRLEKTISRVSSVFDALNREATEFNALLRAATGNDKINVRDLARSIQTGGPQAQLRNAAVRGQLAQFQATSEQMFQKLTNTVVGGMSNFVKAVDRQVVQELAKVRQTTPASTVREIDNQIAAQQYRLAQQVRNRERGLFNSAPAELAALEQLQATRQAMLQTEKEFEKVEKRRHDLHNQFLNARLRGDRERRAALLVEMQQLRVDRERIAAQGAMTPELQAQQARLQRILTIQERITAESRLQREQLSIADAAQANRARARNADFLASQREFRQATILGDGGANLFKIQAQLLGNYLVMNRMFDLLSFGSQFIVQLDEAFTQLQAITATTATEMNTLSDSLIRISESTRFTAVEVAEAAVIMGQAGFSTQQIEESIEAVTLFATAVGTDLKSAVDIATSTLSVFNLQASDMTNVVNQMTAALNLSKLDVDKLALGIQYAGNTAAQSGVQFDELLTVISAFANAGVRSGSTLGTGVRQLFVDLSAPTAKLVEELNKVGLSVEDIDIRSRGFINVLETLAGAGFGAEQAFAALETRAASAFLGIISQIDSIDSLRMSLQLTSAAAAANEVQVTSLANKLDRFRSVLGVVINTALEPAIVAFKGLLETFIAIGSFGNRFPIVLQGIGSALAGLGIAALTTQLARLTAGLFGVQLALTGTTRAFTLLGVAFRITPIGRIIGLATAAATALGLMSTAFSDATSQADKMQAAFDRARGEFDSTRAAISSIDEFLSRLNDRYVEIEGDAGELNVTIQEARNQFTRWGFTLDSNITSVAGLSEAVRGLRGELVLLSSAQARNAIVQGQLNAQQLITEMNQESDQGPGANTSIWNFNTVDDIMPRFTGPIRRLLEQDFVPSDLANTERTSREVTDRLADLQNAQAAVNEQIFAFQQSGLEEVNGASVSDLIEQLQDLSSALEDEAGVAGKLYNQLQIISQTERQASILNFPETEPGRQLSTLLYGGQQGLSILNQRLRGSGTPGGGQTSLAQNQETLQALQELRDSITAQATDIIDGITDEVQRSAAEQQFGQFDAQLAAKISELGGTVDETLEVVTEARVESLDSAISLAKARVNRNTPIEEINRQMAIALEAFDERFLIQLEERQRELAALRINDPDTADLLEFQFLEKTANERDELIESFTKVVDGINASTREVVEQVKDFDEALRQVARTFKLATDRRETPLRSMDTLISEARNGALRNRYSNLQIGAFERRREEMRVENLSGTVDNMRERRDSLEQIIQEIDAAERLGQARLRAAGSAREREQIERQLTELQNERIRATDQLEQANIDLADAEDHLRIVTGEGIAQAFTLGEAFDEALRQYQEASGALKSTTVRLADQLVGLFDSVSNSFTNFARDVVTGNKSIGESFRDLAVSIIEAMLEIAIKEAALQLFGFVTGALGNMFGGGGATFEGGAGFLLQQMGGPVRAMMGRPISGRDSVHALLEPGEFVLRKSAVDAIGRDTLDALNAAGNLSVSRSAPQVNPMMLGRREPDTVNVWVVSPDQKPSMGPKDVIAVVSEDIATRGTIKKLIKSVQMGAI